MNKGIVKYHNDMNKISFTGFTEKELNIFFSLVFLAKEKGEETLIIPFSELKTVADGDKNNDRFIKSMVEVNTKLAKLTHKIEVENIIHIFSLFNTFSIDKDRKELIVEVNKIFRYILNDLVGNFTKFDLIEFVGLKSIYSKNIFKILKQWDAIKYKEFELEEFRNLLGVPVAYNSSKLNDKILVPIMKELPNYFNNLKLEKIKTGRKVTSLKFTWSGKAEKIVPLKNDNVIDIIEISEELNKTIEKAKKNRFIEKLLTIDNIEILTQMFQENDLVKGLIWAYKEVRQDISTLNYLIKTIKTGAEKKEKKIVVKKLEEKQSNLFDKTFEEIPFNFEEEPKEKEVQKISKEEYEKLYKKYLKENKIAHNKVTRLSFDNSIGFKYEVIEIEPQEKIYLLDELPQEKLLSKSGKLLVGGALIARLEKLAKEMQISISHKDKIISYKI